MDRGLRRLLEVVDVDPVAVAAGDESPYQVPEKPPIPLDYRELIELCGGPSIFDEFLNLCVPGSHANRYLDIAWRTETERWALSEDDFSSVGARFGPIDLIVFAVSDNGDVCCWNRSGARSAEEWTIAVHESRGPDWWEFDGTVTEMLRALVVGDVGCPIFPDDFPSSKPKLVPFPPS